MSDHALVHTPVGGKLMTRPFVILLAIAALGGIVGIWRFANGLGAVTNLNNGYPWGLWIAIDVVVGTALGCGGYAVGLLVYILNKGQYHPLVRPAVLTSLLGYGLAMVAVIFDLGRFWGLYQVPIFYWRWSHSPQLEVALCVATYVMVLALELSPALLEKWRTSPSEGLRSFSGKGLRFINAILPWLLALGLLLPTMHQSSLGTMMLLPGPRMHALWFTPWLPLLFLVNCIIIGYAIVTVESSFSSVVFRRKRETKMLASISKVTAWVSVAWIAIRVIDVALTGKLGFLASGKGLLFLAEVALLAVGAGILFSEARRALAVWQVRASILLLLGCALFRVNTYMVAFSPGQNYSYFPAIPELLITFGIIAAEVILYIVAVKRFPILGGAAPAPQSR
jgi:Ni/Fe-hydrogenase subunit HybB-like protein